MKTVLLAVTPCLLALAAPAQSRVALFDVATGRETLHDEGSPGRPAEQWVEGRTGDRHSLEILPEAFSTDLVAVTDQAFPWSAQCRIRYTKPSDGRRYVGSGTLIDPQTVITAGHVVHEGSGGSWNIDIEVIPGFDGDDDAFGSAAATNLGSWAEWTQFGDRDADMGMIRLDRPVGFLTGWFGYGYRDDPTTHYTTTTFYVAGYPSSGCYAGVPSQLYYGFGVYDSITAELLQADCGWTCATDGLGGAGTYWIDSAGSSHSRYVHGVHSLHCTSCSPNTITHTRLTGVKFDGIQDFVMDPYVDIVTDLVPLDVNVTVPAGGIAAGSQLGSLDYLVGNLSLHDPSSDAIEVLVYLSTDDQISNRDTLIHEHSFTHDFGPRTSKRVTLGSPPCIPIDTPPGEYSVGVRIVKADDWNQANSYSNGQDAAKITVVEAANLPAGVRVVGSGYQEGFERFGGRLAGHMAVTRRDAATSQFDRGAWANVGQLGPCLDPANGSFNLELGLDPASTDPHLTETGLVLGLDGTGAGPLALDFSGINYGEESHCRDGVFISTDGTDWQLVLGDWSGMPSTWTRIEGVDLSNTSVDTDGVFYLLFAQSDNSAFGGADGVGIDDICIRPTTLTLDVSNFAAGRVARIAVKGSAPSGSAYVLLSLTGDGPLWLFARIDLSPPLSMLPPILLDRCGRGELRLPLPPGTTGIPVWFQGIDVPNLNLTNPVAAVVQ